MPTRLLSAGLLLAALATPACGADALQEGIRFIQGRSYADAVRVLTADLAGKSEAATVEHLRLIGEAHYLNKDYAKAEAALRKGMTAATAEKARRLLDYRLACTLVRQATGDKPDKGKADEALTRIAAWVRGGAFDERAATLLQFQIELLTPRGRGAQAQIEAAHQQIIANSAKLRPETVAAVHQLLAQFHTSLGGGEQATAPLEKQIRDLRGQIGELEKQKRAVPPETWRTVEALYLQLGEVQLGLKKRSEAARSFEQVNGRGGKEPLAKARLMLAKIAYDERRYDAPAQLLVGKEALVELLPADNQAQAYLILGLAEKFRKEPNAAKAAEWLAKVPESTPGYAQAQLFLGEIYGEKAAYPQAMKAFGIAKAVAGFEAQALLGIARLQLRSSESGNKAGLAAAAEAAKELVTRFPLTQHAAVAKREVVPKLKAAGIDTGFAADNETRQWEELIAAKPDSPEAAQARLALARHHARAVYDGKTLVQPPDWVSVAQHADRIIADRSAAGQLRAEALTLRAQAELASIDPPRPGPDEVAAVTLPKADAAQAVRWLEEAEQVGGDAATPERKRTVRLALIEALMKSPSVDVQARGARLFDELGKEIATSAQDAAQDGRYHALAWTLAKWNEAKGRKLPAAELSAFVAEHKADISPEEKTKLWFYAGQLASEAAKEVAADATQQGWALHIEDSGLSADVDVLATSQRLGRTITWAWPQGGALTAAAALEHLSKTAKQPLVWIGHGSRDAKRGINGLLQSRTVQLKDGPATIADALRAILDPASMSAAWDIGLTKATSTIPLPESEPGDRIDEPIQVLEIFESALGQERFEVLARPWSPPAGASGRNAKVMLVRLLDQIGTLTGVPQTWASGIDRDIRLAKEVALPAGNLTCAKALAKILPEANLRARLVRRDIAAGIYHRANDWLNKVIGQELRNDLEQKAMFQVAMNARAMQRSDIAIKVLRKYASIYDDADSLYFHEVNYFIGEELDRQEQPVQAAKFYAVAAAERLTLLRRPAGPLPTTAATDSAPAELTLAAKADVLRRINADTAFNLRNQRFPEAVANAPLADVVEILARRTQVALRVDAAVGDARLTLAADAARNGLDLLGLVLAATGTDVAGENLKPTIAEFAYFNMARAYLKAEQLPQAAECLELLAARFPNGKTRESALQAQLDVYRSLKRFRDVVATLDAMAERFKDEPAKRRRIDMQLAWLRYEMADYTAAIAKLTPLLAAAQAPAERVQLRENLARALARAGKYPEAAEAFTGLAAESTASDAPVWQVAAWAMRYLAGAVEEREFPLAEQEFLDAYQAEPDAAKRNARPFPDHRRAAWIQWALAQADQKKGRLAVALKRLEAIGSSPDHALAGQALLEAARIHAASQPAKARETLEFILFFNKDAEVTVRALAALAELNASAGRTDEATRLWREVLDRYPLSPFAVTAAAFLGVGAPDAAQPPGELSRPSDAAPKPVEPPKPEPKRGKKKDHQ